MFGLSHQRYRFVYTMYNVHGMKCRCIIIYMYKIPLYLGSHYASEQYEDSDSQTLYTCTHIHVHRGYNYMYMTVHAVATASYYNKYTIMYIVYTPGFLFAFPCIRGRGLGTRLQQLPSPGVKLALRVDVETLGAIFAVGEHPEITQHVLIHVHL